MILLVEFIYLKNKTLKGTYPRCLTSLSLSFHTHKIKTLLAGPSWELCKAVLNAGWVSSAGLTLSCASLGKEFFSSVKYLQVRHDVSRLINIICLIPPNKVNTFSKYNFHFQIKKTEAQRTLVRPRDKKVVELKFKSSW